MAKQEGPKRRLESLDTDPWIQKPRTGSMPSAAQMHALGCVVYNWNYCEWSMAELFAVLTRLSPRIRYTVLQGMGDVTMVEKLRAMPGKLRFGAIRTAIIIHACNLYDINRQNRNALMHAEWIPKGKAGHFAALHKKTGSLIVVAEGVDTIRRVVGEIGDCGAFILSILDGLLGYNRNLGNKLSLPERPPLPEKIVKPLLPIAPRRPRQPPPSQE